MRALPTSLLLAALLALPLTVALPPPRPVHAEIDGACFAAINGVPIGDLDSTNADQAIRVDPKEPVFIEAEAAPASRHQVVAGVVGVVSWIPGTNLPLVEGQFSEGGRLERELRLDGLPQQAGLYRVLWRSVDVDGNTTCTGAVLVRVAGNALLTPLGITASLALAAGGATLVVGSGIAFGAGRRWKLRLVGKAEPKRDESGRWRLRFGLSASGTLAALAISGGLLTLLQQGAVTWPTLEITFGLAIPLVFASWLLQWIAGRLGRRSVRGDVAPVAAALAERSAARTGAEVADEERAEV